MKTQGDATPKERLKRLESVFSALAHPTRRQILMTIHFRGGSMTAGEVASRFGHTWATTTGHIRILEYAQLLTQRRQGRARIYQTNREQLHVVEEWLDWFKRPVEMASVPSAESPILMPLRSAGAGKSLKLGGRQ